jgi:hypothetical protein
MHRTRRSNRLTDFDIRAAIHLQIIPGLIGNSSARVLDELAVCAGDARIDIAVINGKFHGFEIKSEADTLERLKGQVAAYNRVFDTITIICGKNHIDGVTSVIPEWWGIYTATADLGGVRLEKLRDAKRNTLVDGHALAQLLWKSELTSILASAGITKGISNKSCRALWEIVTDTFSTLKLQSVVREVLKVRECWRLDSPQM